MSVGLTQLIWSLALMMLIKNWGVTKMRRGKQLVEQVGERLMIDGD
jgi:hypothetical protein